AHVHDVSQWRGIERLILERTSEKGSLDPLACLALLDAAARSLPLARALPAARELALLAGRAAGQVTFDGWPKFERIPALYLPLESLPAGAHLLSVEIDKAYSATEVPPGGTGDDRARTVIENFREIVLSRILGDSRRVSETARSLRTLGEPAFDIQVAGMERNYLMDDLPTRLSEAKFLLHLGDGVDSEFHIDLWLDYVKTVDPSAILAIRSRLLFEHLRQTRPGIDAVYVKAGLEAEWLVNSCEKLRA